MALQTAERHNLQQTHTHQVSGQVSHGHPSQQQQATEQNYQHQCGQHQGQTSTCFKPQQMQQLHTDASPMQFQGQLTTEQALATEPNQEQTHHRQTAPRVSVHTIQGTEDLLQQQPLQNHLAGGQLCQGQLPQGQIQEQPLDHQTDSQSQNFHKALAELVLWGLHALRAVATALGRGIQTNCAAMMVEYVLQRLNLFSSCWPLDISKLAIEVTAAFLHGHILYDLLTMKHK